MALTGAQIGDVVACGAKVQEVEQGSVETIRFFVVFFLLYVRVMYNINMPTQLQTSHNKCGPTFLL